MHNFAVGLRKRSVYSWILQRELNSGVPFRSVFSFCAGCESSLGFDLFSRHAAKSLFLFLFLLLLFSLLVLHEFVFGIQPMFEFHPSLRLRQVKCFAAAACYYNLRDMVRISICICLEFRFFVKEKDVVSIC